MKHVQACLCDREDRDSSFHRCLGPLWLVEACLCAPFYPPRGYGDARGGLFQCQGRSRKQFSPLWKSCEARACLFMCGKDLAKPF